MSNPETGSFYATQSLPITVVYRADGSGATELLTRHLAAVCTTSNTAVGVTFVDGLVFANNFPDQTVPFNFVSANSDAGIRSTLLGYQSSSTAPAAVAYLSPSYTNSYLAPSSSFAAPAVAVASLLNGNDRRFYAPTAANATLALGNVVPPSKQFTAGNPANWVPPIANPISGYPVSGTSQIIISQCYTSSAVTSAIHDFLTAHYTNATFASIVRGNGFDVIPSFYQRAIQADFLSNASGFNLDIGNAAACASLGR